MTISPNKKIYFASDQHFGAPTPEASFPREQKFVAWLDEIKKDAECIFLLGDLFDFWFEYKTVVPKGFIRVLGKLAEIRDSGIPIYFFVGNHDLWMNDYFEKELNIPVYRDNQEYEFNGKTFLIGHGDGKGPGDRGYKRMKKVFANPFSKWLYRWLHPDLGIQLANYFSSKSRAKTGTSDEVFMGEDKEWLIIYSKQKAKEMNADYFIFGHRHYALDIAINETSRYINLGDWLRSNSYAVFDGQDMQLLHWKEA